MSRADHDHVSALSGDATNYLPDFREGTIAITNQTTDSSVVGDTSDVQCIVKKDATLSLNFRSQNANCDVTGLDTSAFTIATIDFLPYLENLNFSINNQFRMIDGVSDEWTARQFMKQIISATCTVQVPADAATVDNVMLGAWSSTLSGANAVLAFTINSVAFSVPLMVQNAVHKFTRGDIQTWDLSFVQRGPITSPAGTSSLLTKGINAPGTPQAWICTSKAVGGLTYDGDWLPEAISFSVNKQDSIVTAYTLKNAGAIDVAATVA